MRLDQRVPELFNKFKGLGRSRPIVELAGVEAAVLPPSDEPRFMQIQNRLEEARVLDEKRDIRVIDTQPGYYVIASTATLNEDGAIALPPEVEPESIIEYLRIIHDARNVFRELDLDAFLKGEPENKYVKVLVQYVKAVKEHGEGVHVHLDTINVHAYELKDEDPFMAGYMKIVDDIAKELYKQALEGEIKANPVTKIIESPGAIAFAAFLGKDAIMHIVHFGYGNEDAEVKKKLEAEKKAFDAL